MAGLRRGYMFDDWHGTKKYYPTAHKEIQAGLEDKNEVEESDTDDFIYKVFEPYETLQILVRYELLPFDNSDFYIPQDE